MAVNELEQYGIRDAAEIIYNPSYDLLFDEETRPGLTGYEHGIVTTSGAVWWILAFSPGRSPKDKYLVRDDSPATPSGGRIRGKGKTTTKPLSQDTRIPLKHLITNQLSGKRLFVVDAFCGANADTRLKVRFITEVVPAGTLRQKHVYPPG